MTNLQNIKEYIKKLKKKFAGKKIAVLFSGGVDSALIAYAAKDFADAVTIDSEFTFRYNLNDAVKFTKRHKIPHKIITTKFLNNDCNEIQTNPENRCYLCKKKIINEVKKEGYDIILDGTNTDDLKETRPGINALIDEGVISPFLELKFGKEKIMEIMNNIDENFALKPHESCMATRIPYNTTITTERLKRIEEIENYIRNSGVAVVRFRDYFPDARIEVSKGDFEVVVKKRERIVKKIKSCGYETITLNLDAHN